MSSDHVPTAPSSSDIQRFLAALVATEGPAQFIQLLLENPIWLDMEWLHRAEHYVESRQGIRTLFTTRQPVVLWKRITHCIQRAHSLQTFEQLARAAADECLFTWDEFSKIVQAENSRPNTGRLNGFLAARKEWKERLRQVNEIEELNARLDLAHANGEALSFLTGIRALDLATYANRKAPLGADEPSLLFLSALITLYAEFDNQEQAAELVPLLERLETVGFNVRQLQGASAGRPTVFRRTNSSGTALWFLENIPVERYAPVINAVASKKKIFDQALSEAQSIATSVFDRAMQLDKPGRGPLEARPATREFFLVTCSAAFAVLAAGHIESVEQSTASVRAFKQLIGSPWWDKLSPHEKSSTIYRLCGFIMAQGATLNDVHEQLQWAKDLLSVAIEETPFSDYPGLERDMRLAHARIIAELSRWNPSMGADAISEFKRALQVPWGRFDCEARGLGLCDLAGAMWRFKKFAHDANTDEEHAIETLYKTALIYVPRGRYIFSRITVLTNYAIFLNERQTGNDSHNQELALRLVDESIEIEREWRERVESELLENVDELDSPATPHRHTVQASVWLTRGNIIRARTFGQMPAGATILTQIGALPKGLDNVTVSAISSYQEGLRALGEAGHAPLRGLLHLNIGYAYLENRTKQAQHQHALSSFRQAIRFLANTPHDLAQAQVAEIETLYSSSKGPSREVLLAWHRELLRCASVFENFGDLPRACRALLLCSRFLGDIGRTAQLAMAADIASRATGLATRSGGGELLAHALQAEARALVAWMHKSGNASQRSTLAEKALSISAKALETLDVLLRRTLPLSSSIALQEERSAVAANLVWLQKQAQVEPLDPKSRLLTLASAADVLASRAQEKPGGSTSARRRVLRIEDLLWASGRTANVEQHVAEDVEQLVDALDDLQRNLEMEMILRAPDEDEPIASMEQDVNDDAVVIQFVVSEWGGLAVVSGPGTHLRAILLPIDRAAVYEWLHGSGDSPGWMDLYETFRTHGTGIQEWQKQCDVLQAQISRNIWGPLIEAGVVLEGRRIHVVPGQLAALPLHAAHLRDRLLIDVVSGFGYLPTINAKRVLPPTCVRQGLLVLSDPVQPGQSELPATEEEIASIAQVFSKHDVNTRVLAHSWGRTGREVFRAPHCLADGVDIGDAPTAENTLAALSDADLFVYAGHGHGVGSYGGVLALTDGNGKRADLSLMKGLASSPLTRRTGVVLSACETAWAMSGTSHGRTSVASTFLRLGASFVLGSLWLISDARASIMSNTFVRSLLEGGSPEHAFVQGAREMVRSGIHVSRWGAYCIWFGQAPQ